MIAAPLGVPGSLVVDPLLRMARGENALNEHNTSVGHWVHRDGWGAVYEERGRVRIIRGTDPCWEDPAIESMRDREVFLLHARRASRGLVSLENTHPFEQDVDGARWGFCHNGTAKGLGSADRSDSAEIFRRLRPHLSDDRVLEGIRAVYGAILDYTSLNSFLLGPEALWAVCLHTENPDYYTLTLAETDDGPIVSSEPLDELAGEQTTILNGTVLWINRWSGAIETHTLD